MGTDNVACGKQQHGRSCWPASSPGRSHPFDAGSTRKPTTACALAYSVQQQAEEPGLGMLLLRVQCVSRLLVRDGQPAAHRWLLFQKCTAGRESAPSARACFTRSASASFSRATDRRCRRAPWANVAGWFSSAACFCSAAASCASAAWRQRKRATCAQRTAALPTGSEKQLEVTMSHSDKVYCIQA